MSDVKELDKIEKVYEKYFVGNLISYHDHIVLTQAVEDYGAETVLRALRKIYASGRASTISSANYVVKVAQTMSKEKRSAKSSVPRFGKSDFQTAEEAKIADKFTAEVLEQTERRYQVNGYLSGKFREYMGKNHPEIKAAVFAFVKSGGRVPKEIDLWNEAFVEWEGDKSWQ